MQTIVSVHGSDPLTHAVDSPETAFKSIVKGQVAHGLQLTFVTDTHKLQDKPNLLTTQ